MVGMKNALLTGIGLTEEQFLVLTAVTRSKIVAFVYKRYNRRPILYCFTKAKVFPVSFRLPCLNKGKLENNQMRMYFTDIVTAVILLPLAPGKAWFRLELAAVLKLGWCALTFTKMLRLASSPEDSAPALCQPWSPYWIFSSHGSLRLLVSFCHFLSWRASHLFAKSLGSDREMEEERMKWVTSECINVKLKAESFYVDG